MNCLEDRNSQFLICRSLYQERRILRSWGWNWQSMQDSFLSLWMNKCLEWVNDRHLWNPGVFSYAMIPPCCPYSKFFSFIVTSIVYASVHYRFEDRKRLVSWDETLVPLNSSWPRLSKNHDHHPKKTNRSAWRCIWRYRFKGRVWNCQILNQVVQSQLFTSFWNRFHQWLSDIELNQISVFSASYPRINPCFTAGKQIRVRNWHATRGHRKTTIFTSIVHVDHIPFLFLEWLVQLSECFNF